MEKTHLMISFQFCRAWKTFLKSRPLSPGESQQRVFFLIKTNKNSFSISFLLYRETSFRGESLQEGDFLRKYYNLSNGKSFLEECVKIHKDGDEWYPMRCLTFNTPYIESHLTQFGDWRYVSITMKKDVPFITQIDFHEHQRSNCPTTISSDLQMQVMTPRRELYMRYNIIYLTKIFIF